MARHRQPLDLEHHLVTGDRPGREKAGQFAPDHGLGHRVFGKPLGCAGHDMGPVAQDRHAIRDPRHLVQLVRGIEDRSPLRFQPLDLFQQHIRFAPGQHGRRFVHDQHPRIAAERAGDLDHLPVGNGKVPNPGAGIDVAVEPAQQLARLVLHRPAIEERAAPFLAPEKDVLFDRQLEREVEFLVDHENAGILGRALIREGYRLAVEQDSAAGGREIAAEDLHHRRLAGAVLADQRVNLAGHEREIDPVQHLDRAETAGHAPGFENRAHRLTQAALRRDERTQASTKATPSTPSAMPGKCTPGGSGAPVRAARMAAAASA